MKELIEEKIKNLEVYVEKYAELAEIDNTYNYRLNAILEGIDVLEQVLEGNASAKEWEECYKEDYEECHKLKDY